MIILTGSSLNKRHEEFNAKVNEAAKNKLNFEELKDTNESSDIDKLFKIDLASKYKNEDYILEVLKSGDSLYISRALKCDWIADDEFSQCMNPQYLDYNVFPYMSSKMKKKLLATLSMQIRNGERAEEFHHYCMRNRMHKIGMGFLLYTNESFKIEILTLHPHVYNDFDRNEMYLEHFIGNSFLLAEYYLKVVPDFSLSRVFHKLRYLYSVSQDQYLDLMENFMSKIIDQHLRTSLRFSRDIMKKHKKRVLRDPWLYLNILKHDVVAKYSTSEDAKVYAIPFLPDTSSNFWSTDYYYKNKYFLDLIPMGERFSFVKKIYTEKYRDRIFEDNYKFFIEKYYVMMTVQEKEDWALRHVASGEELHGCGNDYKWYQFINFAKSFVELKKYILIASDNDKRSNILNILIDSAKTQEELTILLDYYYDRHINELKDYSVIFLDKLTDNFKVLNFNNECWAAVEKILYSLGVYHKLTEDNIDRKIKWYRMISLIYYIIHEKPIPEGFHEYVIREKYFLIKRMRWRFDNELDIPKVEMIFSYMLQCYTNHVELLIRVNTDKQEIIEYIHLLLDLISTFDKTSDDIPKSVNEYVMSDFDNFKHHQVLGAPKPEFHIGNIMHYLKEDASLVVSKFSTIREYFINKYQKNNINWLIRKLKVYFCHDIAPEYIKLLNECLSVEELYLQTARVAVFGILNLADEEYKINFMKKYVPVDAKIDHVKISRNLLTVQTAICSVACHSRPPLPLSSFRDYIKGDYLQHCIYIFDSYLANLTPDQSISFVESLLDSPVSVQKHGLRLAFRCYSLENLKNLVLKVWKKTKNISLRKILYKELFDKVVYYHDNLAAQWELFEVLTTMTLDLHQDDDEGLFAMLIRELPSNVIGPHLQSAFNVVSTFPERTINIRRLTAIIRAIVHNIDSIPKNFLLNVMEDHISAVFDINQIVNKNLKEGYEELINAKWDLIKTYIIKNKDINILRLVMDECLQKRWYKTHESNYIYRKFWIEFVSDLENLSFKENTDHFLEINDIFRTIMTEMEKSIPHIEIYVLVWQLNVNILTRQVLGEEENKINTIEEAQFLVQDITLKFSKKVGDLMKEYIEKEIYFPCFYLDIAKVIHEGIVKVTDVFNHFIEGIQVVDICIVFCSVLLFEYDLKDMHKFVANALPENYYDVNISECFNYITSKLMSMDDKEIKYVMYHKFYSSDFQHKNFIP